MNQDLKPNLVVLYLSKLQFPNLENDLPSKIKDLKKYGLVIKWTEDDVGPYKKLVPALIDYPESIIITADDDMYYPKYWISRLYNSFLEKPNSIHCHLITKAYYENKQVIFKNVYGNSGDGQSKYFYKILGCGGVLYPPHCLSPDAANKNLFMSLSPTNDDVWFWAMALKNQTKITWIKNGIKRLCYIEHSQEETPCLFKINNYQQNLREIQTKAVFDYYDLYSYLKM